MLTSQSVALGAVLISQALTIPLTPTNPDSSNNLPREASTDFGTSNVLTARELELIARGGSGSVTITPTQYDAEYLVPVQVGPASTVKTYNLALDTGSSNLIVYRAGASQTVSVPVTIGGITVPSQTVQFQPSGNGGFQPDTDSDGTLGLSFSTSSTPKTFFENAAPSLTLSLFTVNLKKAAPGTLTFGAIDPTQYTGAITYVPVNTANAYWEIASNGYAIGTAPFVASSIDALVDTGTTLLYLPKPIVSAYYAKVSGSKYDSAQGGYTFPCATTLPSLTLGIDTYRAVAPGSYLNYAPVSATTCFGGLQANTGIGFSIFGTIFLKSQFVVFKGPKDPMVGFAAKKL